MAGLSKSEYAASQARKGPVSVFGLGVGGVQLTKSPLHMDDSEVIQAQNAEPYRDKGVSGVRKRPAYRPVNSSALAAIQGVMTVELAAAGSGENLTSDYQTQIHVATSAGPGYTRWKTTTDGGATWAFLDALGAFVNGFGLGIKRDPSEDDTTPEGSVTYNFTIRVTDGSAATGDEAFTIIVYQAF